MFVLSWIIATKLRHLRRRRKAKVRAATLVECQRKANQLIVFRLGKAQRPDRPPSRCHLSGSGPYSRLGCNDFEDLPSEFRRLFRRPKSQKPCPYFATTTFLRPRPMPVGPPTALNRFQTPRAFDVDSVGDLSLSKHNGVR